MIIIIILALIIGKPFYDLAVRFKKNTWLHAALGVMSYYVGYVIAVYAMNSIYKTEEDVPESEILRAGILIGIIAFGAICSRVLYVYLKKTWERDIK